MVVASWLGLPPDTLNGAWPRATRRSCFVESLGGRTYC